MNMHAQALESLYTKHASAIRWGLFALFVLSALVWTLVMNVAPSHAMSIITYSTPTPEPSGGITDPIQPDGSSLGERGRATLIRFIGFVIYCLAALAFVVTVVLTGKYLVALLLRSESAAGSGLVKAIFISLTIFAILTASGTGMYIWAAQILGEVFFF